MYSLRLDSGCKQRHWSQSFLVSAPVRTRARVRTGGLNYVEPLEPAPARHHLHLLALAAGQRAGARSETVPFRTEQFAVTHCQGRRGESVSLYELPVYIYK